MKKKHRDLDKPTTVKDFHDFAKKVISEIQKNIKYRVTELEAMGVPTKTDLTH